MPELPEVETVKRVIEPQIKGRKILDVDVRNEQVIAFPDADVFSRSIMGSDIKGMSRRGKFLSIDLYDSDKIYLHLRMTGQLLVTPKDYPIEKHTHIIIDLSGDEQIRYIDVRRFGRFWYLQKDDDISVTGIDNLGIEPASNKLSTSYIKSMGGMKKKAIKELLLDQSVVAGIGNIYADEILFASGIHPARMCCDLTVDDWNSLVEKIPEVIKWATEANKISADDYLAGNGKDYRNTPMLKVYGHAGDDCPICGTAFEKIKVSGRGTTYCPNCQIKG